MYRADYCLKHFKLVYNIIIQSCALSFTSHMKLSPTFLNLSILPIDIITTRLLIPDCIDRFCMETHLSLVGLHTAPLRSMKQQKLVLKKGIPHINHVVYRLRIFSPELEND